MKTYIDKILQKPEFSRDDIIHLLSSTGSAAEKLFRRAEQVRLEELGNGVFLRGLIEISNVCRKNCLYCGIRKDNGKVRRYSMPQTEVLEAARRAMEEGFRSIVLQCGEVSGPAFTRRISSILEGIRELSGGKMHVTLSCGEQSEDTYKEWLEAGAHRYLLRIETSNEKLYRAIHPDDIGHCQKGRLDALRSLRDLGYQTGSGVMIGFPGQTVGDLADDLVFLKEFDVDMVGMGPFIEEKESPLYPLRHQLWTGSERFFMTRKMVAVLRLMMPDINIAATTASEAILPGSREILIATGANVIMPNITPPDYRADYSLYDNKPNTGFSRNGRFRAFTLKLERSGYRLLPGDPGDPRHFRRKQAGIPAPSGVAQA